MRRALVEVLAVVCARWLPAGVRRRAQAARARRVAGVGQRAQECEALLGRVQMRRAVQRREDTLRKKLCTAARRSACLAVLKGMRYSRVCDGPR